MLILCLSSIMSSISSSSIRPRAPATSSSSTTAPKLHRQSQQPPVPAQLALAARRVSLNSKERRMTRRSPRWSIDGGISATSTSIRPMSGRTSTPRRTTRRTSGETLAATPFSFRNEVASDAPNGSASWRRGTAVSVDCISSEWFDLGLSLSEHCLCLCNRGGSG